MVNKIRVGAATFGLAACLLLAGCATGKVRVRTAAPGKAIQKYGALVIAVLNDVGPKCPDNVAPAIQAAAVRQIKVKYPGVFADVRPACTGAEGELFVEVHITKYKKGSRLGQGHADRPGIFEALNDLGLYRLCDEDTAGHRTAQPDMGDGGPYRGLEGDRRPGGIRRNEDRERHRRTESRETPREMKGSAGRSIVKSAMGCFLYGDDDFPAGAPLFEIPKGRGRFA